MVKIVDADTPDGLGSVLVKIEDGSFTVPEGIQGYSFVLVTSASDISAVSCELLKLMPGVPCADPLADNIIAGPAEMQTRFNSRQENPGFMNPYGA